jgi:hypothetical protein
MNVSGLVVVYVWPKQLIFKLISDCARRLVGGKSYEVAAC